MSEYSEKGTSEYRLTALKDECRTLGNRLNKLEYRVQAQEQLLETLAIQIKEANAKLNLMQDDGK